jgi:dipeptidyl-peptidase-4
MMKFMRPLLAVLLVSAGLAWTAAQAPAAEAPAAPEKLTLDLLFSPAVRQAFALPTTLWLADGTALIMDRRLPPDQVVIERFDPATGQRTPAFDATKAIASLNSLLDSKSEEKAPNALPFPEEVDKVGRTALYTFFGDIFLLDLPTSTFRRLIHTPAEEQDVRFSPEGRKLAYVRDNNLYVLDIATGKEEALTHDGSKTLLNGTLSWVYWEEIFGREDLAYWWSPDSGAIAFLKTDESMVDVSVFPGYEPATPEVVKQRYPKAGSKNPVVQVCIAEVGSGKTITVKQPEPRPEYVLRVNWLPHSRTVAVQVGNRAQNRTDLLLADRKTGRAPVVFTETGKTWINVHDDLHFLAGGEQFLWTSERDGHNHLYLYDIHGKLLRQLTSGDMMIRASSGVAWVRGGVCAIDEKAGFVYFTATTTLPLAPELYRVPLAGGKTEKISMERGRHRVSFDPAVAYYFDDYSSSTRPPGLTLRHADGSLAFELAEPNLEFLARYDVQYPQFATFRTDDGVTLPAQIFKPADFDPARKYPVILYVYGGPGAPSVWDAFGRDALYANLLGQYGYIYAVMDNRSACGLSKTMEDTSYHKMMSADEVPDIEAGVRWLKSQPGVDPDRIGVWGWSGGGTFTLQLMTHSKVFKAGIAVAAVTDFRYYDTRWAEAVMGLPKDNPEGYKAGATANFAKDLSGRLLLVHGTFDDNVHPQNAWRFARELQKAGIVFDMMIYPLEKHGISSLPSIRKHVYQTMLDFWLRNL